ncbi:L-threonylcarbamoyladenylate synthase [Methylohalobius crimeensis]|uniref:L-threonylcarbamoyladenylate synthase n=1 Tax=Methylohalobius crimeensis TaxID=244365 RepID=UPI00047D315F|nr:L-threonylcarbamoyladenylate synthase [Methylohalobius crimeensis]
MAQYFQIHPETPQPRLIRRAVDILREGGVIVYPTDSSYALACRVDDKRALARIRRIRQLGEKHNFTLICRDLSHVSQFVRLSNEAHRLIKALTSGPYTFVLRATREVPRRLQHPSRKTVGIRVPDHPIAQALLAELDEPLFTTTLIPPGEEHALEDPEEIRQHLEKQVELVIDAGIVPYEPTTVIIMTDDLPEIVRYGKGRDKLEALLG